MVDPGTAVAVANTVLNVAKAFGGGGQGNAYATGYRISGTATPAGFSGLVAGLGKHGSGAPYIDEAGAWGEKRALNEYVAKSWTDYLGTDQRPVELRFDAPYNWDQVTATVNSAFQRAAQERAVNATSILSTVSTKPAIPSSSSAPATSTTQPAPATSTTQQAAAPAGSTSSSPSMTISGSMTPGAAVVVPAASPGSDLVPLLLLAGVAWYVLKG